MGTLFGIPTSLLSSAFGAITGFIFKARAQSLEIQAAERKHNMEMIVAVAKANTQAAKDEANLLKAKADYEERLSKTDPHRSMARRVLAYGLMIGIVFVLPGLIVFGPLFGGIEIQWFQIFESTRTSGGFFGIGAYSKQVIEVITANGLPLQWLLGLLDVFAGVISFYFGGSLAKFRNPYTK